MGSDAKERADRATRLRETAGYVLDDEIVAYLTEHVDACSAVGDLWDQYHHFLPSDPSHRSTALEDKIESLEDHLESSIEEWKDARTRLAIVKRDKKFLQRLGADKGPPQKITLRDCLSGDTHLRTIRTETVQTGIRTKRQLPSGYFLHEGKDRDYAPDEYMDMTRTDEEVHPIKKTSDTAVLYVKYVDTFDVDTVLADVLTAFAQEIERMEREVQERHRDVKEARLRCQITAALCQEYRDYGYARTWTEVVADEDLPCADPANTEQDASEEHASGNDEVTVDEIDEPTRTIASDKQMVYLTEAKQVLDAHGDDIQRFKDFADCYVEKFKDENSKVSRPETAKRAIQRLLHKIIGVDETPPEYSRFDGGFQRLVEDLWNGTITTRDTTGK